MEAIWDALYRSFWDVTPRWFKRLVRYRMEVREWERPFDGLFWDENWSGYWAVNSIYEEPYHIADNEVEAEYFGQVWGIAPRL